MNDWADKQAYASQEEVVPSFAADRPPSHKWLNSAYVPRASRIFEQPPGLPRATEPRLPEPKEDLGLGKRLAGFEEDLCGSNLVHLGAEVIATIVLQKGSKPTIPPIAIKAPSKPFAISAYPGDNPPPGQQTKTEVFVKPLPCLTPLKTSHSCSLSLQEASEEKDHLYLKKLKLKNSADSQDSETKDVLSSLLRLLDKQEIGLHHLEGLTEFEYTLVKSLVKKMYAINLSEPVSPEDLVQCVNSTRLKGKPKRLEEELKLVFKKTMKHLFERVKEGLDREQNERLNKLGYVRGFYKYYFESTFEDNETFRNYFQIQDSEGKIDFAKLNKVLVHPLTVNAQFISAISLSKKFKEDMKAFVGQHLLAIYRETRTAKLKRILLNFYDLLSKRKDHQAIEEYINNQQTKLPWATLDLKRAVETFLEILNST